MAGSVGPLGVLDARRQRQRIVERHVEQLLQPEIRDLAIGARLNATGQLVVVRHLRAEQLVLGCVADLARHRVCASTAFRLGERRVGDRPRAGRRARRRSTPTSRRATPARAAPTTSMFAERSCASAASFCAAMRPPVKTILRERRARAPIDSSRRSSSCSDRIRRRCSTDTSLPARAPRLAPRASRSPERTACRATATLAWVSSHWTRRWRIRRTAT